MFTGIVQAVAPVLALEPNATGARLSLAVDWAPQPGESVAVNGCCLTALPAFAPAGAGAMAGSKPAEASAKAVAFDLSRETLARTSLGSLQAAGLVNLERALRAGDALGGHLMAGHVDGLAELTAIEVQGDGALWTLRSPDDLARFIADKGSVALDGVSLTPFGVQGSRFQVALIPHTLRSTQFHTLKVGDVLNLEVDILARYVQRLLAAKPC